MECPHCSSTNLQDWGLSNNRKQMYKCHSCGRIHTIGVAPRARRISKQEKPCIHCGELTKNPKFCSRSCTATYNNQLFPKRKPVTKYKIGSCKRCGAEIIGRRSVCDGCLRIDWSKLSLGDIAGDARYQIHAVVRKHSRMTYAESHRPKQCMNCGYNKHYEICHIRAINDFPLETMLLVVNDLSNLIALCPNCHWEFDHNHLSMEEIRAKNNAMF